MRFPLWRVGRKKTGPAGRTLYERVYTDGPSDDDKFIGIMETPELARRVVDAVNIVAQVNNPGLGESRVRFVTERCRYCQAEQETEK